MAVTNVLDMPLSQFERDGRPIEIAVPGLPETIFFVPGEYHANTLVAEGVRRGRIWTAAELGVIAAVPNADQVDLLNLAKLKAQFDGDVVGVLEEETAPAASETPGPTAACRACRGMSFWKSVHGAVICGDCHPPAAEDLVAEWVDVPDGSGGGGAS